MRAYFAVALCTAFAFIFTACNDATEKSPSEKSITPNEVSAAAADGSIKFGYVNTDSLSAQYEMIKDLEEKILSKRMQMENDLQSMVKDLEKDYTDAQQGAAGLSQEALAILQQKLQQKEQGIMMQRDRMEGELMQFEQDQTTAYLKTVHEFLDEYAKAKGFDMIYGFNGLVNLLYIDKSYDITNEVVDSLNVIYANSKLTAEK